MSEIASLPTGARQRQGSNIGQPMTRRDGVLKVTGRATYASDNNPEGLLHAVVATATIARGRVTHLDVEAAKAHPGVVDVLTPQNRPALAQDPDEKLHPFMFRMDLLQNDTVRYAGQAIALVIAEHAGGCDRGRGAARPAIRSGARPRRPRRRALRSGGGRARRARRAPRPAISTPNMPARRRRWKRPTRRRRSITTRWSRIRSWRSGTATGCRSTCRRRRWGWPSAAYAGLFGIPAGEHPHPQPLPRRRLRLQGRCSPGRRCSASSPRGMPARRSSWS